jgi:Icc-related predicted phosphoesterase
MRAIVIADDDELVGRLDVENIDLLISLGDLWAVTLKRVYIKYRPRKVFAVRGNHDLDTPFPAFVTHLHDAVESYGGLTFGGFDGCWRYKPRGLYLYDQAEVSELFSTFPRVDVFVAHNSPRGFHERGGDVHQGFDGFRDYIERVQPQYFFHGHQHLNQTTRIGKTELIGVFGEMLIELTLPPTEKSGFNSLHP